MRIESERPHTASAVRTPQINSIIYATAAVEIKSCSCNELVHFVVVFYFLYSLLKGIHFKSIYWIGIWNDTRFCMMVMINTWTIQAFVNLFLSLCVCLLTALSSQTTHLLSYISQLRWLYRSKWYITLAMNTIRVSNAEFVNRLCFICFILAKKNTAKSMRKK